MGTNAKHGVFVIGLLMVLNTYGQEEMGVKLDIGASVITYNLNNENFNTDFSSKPGPSGNLGLFYNFHVSKRSLVAFELAYMRIETREIINNIAFVSETGQVIAYGTSKERKRISYFTLPIYYGFKFSKWSVNFGVQFSTVLSSSSEVRLESEFYNQTYKNDLPLNTLDYGPRIGLTWQFSENFYLEGVFYQGISNIVSESDPYNEKLWRVQQLVLGIKYSFYKYKMSDVAE